jgi:hypothetical protein
MRVFEPPEFSTARLMMACSGVSRLWLERPIKGHGVRREQWIHRSVDPDFVPTRHYVVRP